MGREKGGNRTVKIFPIISRPGREPSRGAIPLPSGASVTRCLHQRAGYISHSPLPSPPFHLFSPLSFFLAVTFPPFHSSSSSILSSSPHQTSALLTSYFLRAIPAPLPPAAAPDGTESGSAQGSADARRTLWDSGKERMSKEGGGGREGWE